MAHSPTIMNSAWRSTVRPASPPAEKQLHALVQTLIEDAAQEGQMRSDVTPVELATFCLHALSAASTAPSKAATQTLVGLILDGLRSSDPRPATWPALCAVRS